MRSESSVATIQSTRPAFALVAALLLLQTLASLNYDFRLKFASARIAVGTENAVEIGEATRGIRAIGPAGNPGAFPRLLTSSGQLQSKFKHAADFGISGSYSPANAQLFGKALQSHLDDALRFPGTYRGESVIHNLNPSTGLNVIQSPAGDFISGWRLSPQQLVNLFERGSL